MATADATRTILFRLPCRSNCVCDHRPSRFAHWYDPFSVKTSQKCRLLIGDCHAHQIRARRILCRRKPSICFSVLIYIQCQFGHRVFNLHQNSPLCSGSSTSAASGEMQCAMSVDNSATDAEPCPPIWRNSTNRLLRRTAKILRHLQSTNGKS